MISEYVVLESLLHTLTDPRFTEPRERIPAIWHDQLVLVCEVPGRGLCAVEPFIFSSGLLVNVTFSDISDLVYEYDARYCYESHVDALRALADWDGVGDPSGPWIKEKVSERPGPGSRRR